MENRTLTDKIYQELVDGLKTGLDWIQFLAKYGGSKGPLYNAIGRFFSDMEPKVKALNEAQRKLHEAGFRLDSLDEKIKEAESSLAPLEEKKNALNDEIESLESKLAEKRELLGHAGELGKLGFDIERLRQLREALTEIGSKSGLKGKEAVDKFFDDLKDYGAVLEAELQLKGLQTQIETKKLEAEKWQAEADNLPRRYKELSEAISAVQNLTNQGVKQEQIVSWNESLIRLGGAQEFEKALSRYKSVQGLLAAKRREVKKLEAKMAKLNGEVNTLRQQKAEIEGSIKVLRASAVTEIEKVSQTGIETVKAQKGEIEGSIKRFKASALKEIEELSQTGVEKLDKLTETGNSSIRAIGETALSQLKEALSLVDQLSKRAFEVGETIGQLEGKLNKSKELREKTEALVAGIEGGR